MVRKFQDFVPPSRLVYQAGRTTCLRLRKCKLSIHDSGQAKEFSFTRQSIRLGAMEDNDLVINDETVSRYHCLILQSSHSYILYDLHSTNGTFLDGVRIREAYLVPGCTITLGGLDMKFTVNEEPLDLTPSPKDHWGNLVGRHIRMRELYGIAERVASTDTHLLIEGEAGTGRRTLAKALHAASSRASKPFIAIDCSTLSPQSGEADLLGEERAPGASAAAFKKGAFELSSGGTLFLHEIDQLPLRLQQKAAEALERGEIKRLGTTWPMKVDIRAIASLSFALQENVKANLCEELASLLSEVKVSLPPLRERKEDILMLIKHVLKTHPFNRDAQGSLKVKTVSREALELLVSYPWPQNVAELTMVMENAVALAQGDTITDEHLSPHFLSQTGPTQESLHLPFKEAKDKWVTSFERDYLVSLLRRHEMNISQAARDADIDRKYLRKLIRKYNITVKEVMSLEAQE